MLVFDGQHMHYCINGIWQGKRRESPHYGMMWKMQELRFGCSGDNQKFFEGQIDKVRISNVARYTDNFSPVASVTTDKSTLALYNFDEGNGDVLLDSSGNGHHGTILGATWVSPKEGREIAGDRDNAVPAAQVAPDLIP